MPRKKAKNPVIAYAISVGIDGYDDNFTFEATFKADVETKEVFDIISYCKDWQNGNTHYVPEWLAIQEKKFIMENMGYWQKVEDKEDDFTDDDIFGDDNDWDYDDNYQTRYAEENY